MNDLCLDTGALLAVERGNPWVRGLIDARRAAGARVLIPVGVIAQAWRGGATRQAWLARFLHGDNVEVALDSEHARAVGVLCARTGASDIVDGHVAFVARQHDADVVTSDPDDIARFGPGLRIVVV